MTVKEAVSLTVTILSVIGSILFAALAFRRNQKCDDQDQAKADATVLVELGHIKGTLEEIKQTTEKQAALYMTMLERLTAVEASAKQAHKRLDRIERASDETQK